VNGEANGPVTVPEISIRAAGGVVVRPGPEPEYLVVHRPDYGDWSLPKGKLDAGERFKQAALREVYEETGLEAKPLRKLGSISYETPNGNGKIVRYWLLESTGGKFRRNSEVDEIVWLPARKAAKRLSYSRDREVLEWAAALFEQPRTGRVHLVRHADAGNRKDWKGDDLTRPLSRLGQKQTAALHDHLTRTPVTRVLSSNHVRCRDTVAPVATSLGIDIEIEKSLFETRPPEELLGYLRSIEGHSVVMSSHGDVISGVIGKLAAEKVRLKGPLRWAKGSIWVIDLHRGRVQQARYLPAPI
jgi:8-oxo-dGTP diphosphatase